jgi:hypothetical protein
VQDRLAKPVHLAYVGLATPKKLLDVDHRDLSGQGANVDTKVEILKLVTARLTTTLSLVVNISTRIRPLFAVYILQSGPLLQ